VGRRASARRNLPCRLRVPDIVDPPGRSCRIGAGEFTCCSQCRQVTAGAPGSREPAGARDTPAREPAGAGEGAP